MYKPKTSSGYGSESVELVLATCRYIATILGDFLDEIVIVGGLVPSLIVDQTRLTHGAEPHAGTLDLDIGLSLAIFDDELYREISERLRSSGFARDKNTSGNLTNHRWQIEANGSKVTIDFLIPPTTKGEKPGSVKNLEGDFGALISSGLSLAFQDFDEIILDGLTIKGEIVVNKRMRVCGPGAYVVLKSFALNNRGENKDAYDLYYIIRNYGDNPDEAAKRFIGLGSNEHCERAITILKENFLELDSVGVKRATEFIVGEGVADEDLQAEIRAFMVRFIDKCS